MKIDVKLPGGGELHMERPPREPMSGTRFEMLYWLAAGVIAAEMGIRFMAMFL